MISEVFIRRTRLAIVISIIISIAGAIAIFSLPIQQYPQITPPTVNVSAVYPGASAEVIADVVGGPLETAINGVDGMMYMSSTSSNAGQYSLSVTFEVGTDSRTCTDQCSKPRATGDFPTACRGGPAGRIGPFPFTRFRAGNRILFAGRQPERA